MRTFGLIGKKLTHSFSAQYFNALFKKQGLTAVAYKLFPLAGINDFPNLLIQNPSLCGLNVTIPYKEAVLAFAHELSEEVKAIGAANTLKYIRNNKGIIIKAYNTDYYGFLKSLENTNISQHKNALILGTGGAAKAVAHALKSLNINHTFVSRQPGKKNTLSYNQLNHSILNTHTLIINATPVGMHPLKDFCPDISYSLLTAKHFVYDLIYNPEETLFLKKAKEQNAYICNGLKMLYAQAEKSWEIWNDEKV